MIVYLDVLLFVNFFLDISLLKVTALISGERLSLKRLIVSALVASLFSLYIFLPVVGFVFELLMRLFSSIITVFVCFRFKSVKRFFRAFFTFYAVSFIFAGAILGLKLMIPDSKVIVSNGIVYFDISPVVLIALSFVIYLVIYFARKLTQKTAVQAKRLNLKISIAGRETECVGMVDSGHSLKDAFGESMVVIIDKTVAERLVGTTECNSMLSMIPPSGELRSRFRLIPVKTVSGERMLPGVRCDLLAINDENGVCLANEKYPIAVISESRLGDDFSAILPTFCK